MCGQNLQKWYLSSFICVGKEYSKFSVKRHLPWSSFGRKINLSPSREPEPEPMSPILLFLSLKSPGRALRMKPLTYKTRQKYSQNSHVLDYMH